MRVLAAIIVPPHLSASGGARAGLRLSDALAGHCDMTVATMGRIDGNRPSAAARVAVRSWLPAACRALPQRYRSLFYRSNIPDLVRTGKYDLVHIHNPMPALEMARVARACMRSGTPYLVSTHGFNELANGNVVYGLGFGRRQAWQVCVDWPVSYAVSNAAGICALSPADFDIVKSFGFAQTPAVVPNGVEPPELASVHEDQLVWRRFDVPARKAFAGITCMFLGNHTPNKGVPVLLDAFSRLECPFLLIVGGERRPEIDYGPAERLSRVTQRIIVTGHLSDHEIGALLRRSDLFVFPTLADTFPLVVLEAMVNGVPVLASSVGGIPHQVDANSGELVAPGDVVALQEAVTRLAGERARLRTMGAAARTRAITHFTWDAAADAAFRAYQRAVPQAGRVLTPSRRPVSVQQ